MSKRNILRTLPFLLAATLAAACNPADDGATATGDGEQGGGGEGATQGGELTLENCETNIADDVPAFYKKYFRCVDISMSGTDVVIKTNDLPPHKSPYYSKDDPNWVAFDTQGGDRFQNPNQLSKQNTGMMVPANPTPKGIAITDGLVDGQAGDPAEYHASMGAAFGVSLDGVAMFHGVAAPGDDLMMQEHTFDTYEGHPENTGAYHYHGPSPGPLEAMKANELISKAVPGQAEIELFALMCDGTLMLGCTELDGSEPESGDFDGQNGHVHDIAADGEVYFKQRYHTHVCRSKFTNHLFSPEIQYYVDCKAAPGVGGGDTGTGGGGTGGGGGGMGPKACTSSADCTDACPPGSKGCTCAQTMMGQACIPSCSVDADCPAGMNGEAMSCDPNKGICIPKK